jgi:hypothetical protein
MKPAAACVLAALALAGMGCGAAKKVADPCPGGGPSLALGSGPTLAHPLVCARRTTLAKASAALGGRLVLPSSTLVGPADAEPVWIVHSGRTTNVAVAYPSRRVIVEFERPAPSDGSAAHFRAMAKGMNEARLVRLGGRVPAFVVKQNSESAGHNFGAIIFNLAGGEIRVLAHTDEASLEALALSILERSANRGASDHYSVRRVERAFAARSVQLRNVTPKDFRGLLAFLDGRPSHAVYVYVIQKGCKCTLESPFRHATTTRHGNVEVLWRRGERSAVHAALRELG